MPDCDSTFRINVLFRFMVLFSTRDSREVHSFGSAGGGLQELGRRVATSAVQSGSRWWAGRDPGCTVGAGAQGFCSAGADGKPLWGGGLRFPQGEAARWPRQGSGSGVSVPCPHTYTMDPSCSQRQWEIPLLLWWPSCDLGTLLIVKKKCSKGYRLADLSKDEARKMKTDSPEPLAK